jgi:LysM repeat protein
MMSTPLDDGLRIDDDDITLEGDQPKGPAASGGGVYFKLLLAGVVAAGLVVILVVILSSPSGRPGRPGVPGIAAGVRTDSARVAALARQVRDLQQDVKVLRENLGKLALNLKRLQELGAASGGPVKAAALRPLVIRIVDDRLKKKVRALRPPTSTQTNTRLAALGRRVQVLERQLAGLKKAASRPVRPKPKPDKKKKKKTATRPKSFFGEGGSGSVKVITHTVKSDENLFRIAKRYRDRGYRVTAKDIQRWNKISDPKKVWKGMRLKIQLRR